MLAASSAARAGADQSWNELESYSGGGTGGVLVLLALAALAIHLLAQGDYFGVLRDLLKGLALLASMYLIVFGFLCCIIGISILLQHFGMTKDASGFIAFPLGSAAMIMLCGAYDNWRKKRKAKNEP